MSTELLTKLEKERLVSLNDRTTCLSFAGNIPTAKSLLQLRFPYQSLNFHQKTNSIFVIFEDLESKREGIEILENGRVDGMNINIDFARKCVPVSVEELEESRELDILAIHGVPHQTQDDEILDKFPKGELSVAGSCFKGGTVFLNYQNPQHAVQDFVRNDNVCVRGRRLSVLFSHSRAKLLRHRRGSDHDKDWRLRREEPRHNRRDDDGRDGSITRHGRDHDDDGSSPRYWRDDGFEEGSRRRIQEHRDKRSRLVEDLRHKIDEKKNDWDDFISFVLDNLDANDDSLDYQTMMETLEFSGMEISQMRDQVEGCHSHDSETKIKIQWMDRIVQTIISIENLPGSKVGHFSRGLIREFVELVWNYCEERFTPITERVRMNHEVYDYNEDLEGYKRRRRSCSPRQRSRSPLFVTIPASADLADEDDLNRNSTLMDSNSNFTDSCPDMANYLNDSLIKLGINEKQADKVTNKILVCLTLAVEISNVKKVVHTSELAELLEKAGYKSGHVGARVAAEIIINFMQQDSSSSPPKSKKSKKELPALFREVEEGFPRMAVVMAYYLHNYKGYEEEVSKDLARSMVGVWITFGVTYHQLKQMCFVSDKRNSFKQQELRSLLNSKLDEGKEKPKLFQFSSLIELTIRYFLKAID